MKNKGQASNIVGSMVVILLVGFLGIIALTVYDSIQSSLTSSIASTTSDAYTTVGNFTSNFYDGQDLVANLPIVLAAGILITVIVGFAMYVRG